jgi:hypothetical protein
MFITQIILSQFFLSNSSCDALPTAKGVNRHKKGLDMGAGPCQGKTLQGVVGLDPAFGREPVPLSVTA